MSAQTGELVAVSITHEEARVWLSTNAPGITPERFVAPTDGKRHRHTRMSHDRPEAQAQKDTTAFFEAITDAVSPSERILLVGHGRGKANEMLHLIQYWERRHPDVAVKVVGAIDSDLEALTDNEVLALVRQWYEEHSEFI